MNLDSSNTTIVGDDDDDDVVEVDQEVVDNNPKRGRKRRLTSQVWQYFEMIKPKVVKAKETIDGIKSSDAKEAEPKQRCKCKKCGTKFICDSKYGTGNLKRHIASCVRRDTRDVGQMLIDGQHLSIRSSKFDSEKFRELLVAAIVMHELPLSFVEYAGVRLMLSYLNPDVSIISR